MLRIALALLVLGSLTSCNSLRDCIPEPGSQPDYAEASAWACRPDVEGDACDIDLDAVEILPDGTTQLVDHVAAVDPPIDCFYVYPTVDLSLGAGLHDDLADQAAPYETAGVQAARFSEVCRVFAPLYRQVTLGTYVAREEVREACFDVAYEDVLAAFEHYLEHDNQGRGFVLVSHSQGSQITSRLVHERIEVDADLSARLVAALPIGWGLATASDELVGGSFESTPVCTSAEQLGCVVGYRSYAAGNEFPVVEDRYAEGEQGVCVHPADVGGGGPTRLSRSYFAVDTEGAQFPDGVEGAADWVLYRDLYEARCVEEGSSAGLEVRLPGADGDVRSNPLDFEALLVSGKSGTHVYDMHLGLGDLIDLVGVKAQAYVAAAP